MPKQHSSREIITVLIRHGFRFISQRGSHAKYRQDNNIPRTVIIPIGRRAIPHGTFRSILRQSGLTEENF